MQCNTSMHSHLNLPCLFAFSAMLEWEPKSCMTCCTTTRKKCCFWQVAQQFARRWQRRLECGTWSLSATEHLHQPCQTGRQMHSSQVRLGKGFCEELWTQTAFSLSLPFEFSKEKKVVKAQMLSTMWASHRFLFVVMAQILHRNVLI